MNFKKLQDKTEQLKTYDSRIFMAKSTFSMMKHNFA